jgi:hypothetical protein
MGEAEGCHDAIAVAVRPDAEEYYVTIPPEVSLRQLERLDELLAEMGLELMDEDECPSELLEDGSVRVWCAQVGGGV